MPRAPRVGEQAPDFELDGTAGAFRLSDHRGERVVLLFYPGDFTTVCTAQFCSYRDRAQDFSALGATLVGISAQDVASHERFIAENSLTVPLLADTEQVVAKAYSVDSPKWSTDRSVIIIDGEGVVRYRHDPETPAGFHSVDDLDTALNGLGG
jgi:thioredoxin-dependent peroxiredoxin